MSPGKPGQFGVTEETQDVLWSLPSLGEAGCKSLRALKWPGPIRALKGTGRLTEGSGSPLKATMETCRSFLGGINKGPEAQLQCQAHFPGPLTTTSDHLTYLTHQLPDTGPEETRAQGGKGLICGPRATQGQSPTVLRPSSGYPGTPWTEAAFCVYHCGTA